MTTGKTIALARWTCVGKVMSLLLNMLSAAVAKSLQSCPTLCDPIDSSPPGSTKLDYKESCAEELMLLKCGVGEDS